MLLGLDLGTTNIKATVLNDSGALVAEGAAAVDRFHTADGGAEQDIEQIWDAACQALRQATAEIDTAAIRGIGVSAQGGAIQLLDADDQPLGRVISWMDQRGRPYGEQFTRKLGEQFLASRIGHGVCNCMTAQFFRLREEKPRSLAKPNRVGFVGDMIVGRLCGRRAHEATSLAIVLPYNLRLALHTRDEQGRWVAGVGKTLALGWQWAVLDEGSFVAKVDMCHRQHIKAAKPGGSYSNWSLDLTIT